MGRKKAFVIRFERLMMHRKQVNHSRIKLWSEQVDLVGNIQVDLVGIELETYIWKNTLGNIKIDWKQTRSIANTIS